MRLLVGNHLSFGLNWSQLELEELMQRDSRPRLPLCTVQTSLSSKIKASLKASARDRSPASRVSPGLFRPTLGGAGGMKRRGFCGSRVAATVVYWNQVQIRPVSH